MPHPPGTAARRGCRPWPARSLALVALASCGLVSACGTGSSGGSPAAHIAKARAEANDLWKRSGAPGMAVAVAIDGKLAWSEGFGLADVERRVPATGRALFRIGSVSKVLTAAGVALLVQQGKLDLDAPVQRYVPEFPDKGPPVTTRQLAGHLAGIRHYRWDESRPTEPQEDVIAALDRFKGDPLESPPGSRFSYSSYGWVLVGAVVQRAAGEPFLDFMASRVFEAIGMPDTRPETNDPWLPGRAALYERGHPVAPDEVSYIRAAGGFLSTVEDLARFGSAFLPGSDMLEAATLETIFAPQATSGGEPTRFGIGWMVDSLDDGTPVYHHTGTLTGGQAALLVNPADRVVVAILANQASPIGASDCQKLACLILGRRGCPAIAGESRRRATKAREIPALLDALRRWEAAMEGGEAAQVLPLLSPEFRSPLWSGRAALEERLRGGGLEVDIEDIHVRSAGWDVGAVVRVEGVRLGPPPGDPVVVRVVREESGWKILAVEAPE